MSGKEYYNFVVLGAEAAGKTCLCSCFARGLFVEQHAPTIDDEYKKTITYGTEVDLTIADLGGWHPDSLDQDCLQRIKWAQGVVLVYDTTNPASFQMLDLIKSKVDQVKDIKTSDEFKFPIIVVGTKTDLEQLRAVTGSELKKWADEHGISYYTEVGLGKDVYGAKEVFVRLIGDIRAQEQARKEAAAAKSPAGDTEKRKSLMSPRSLLSPRKRSQTSVVEKATNEDEAAGAAVAASGTPAKEKEKEMKKEQKEKEKEMKKQLKDQKAKEKEEKERQKREQKEKQKAEKEVERQEKLEQKERERNEKKEQELREQELKKQSEAKSEEKSEAVATPEGKSEDTTPTPVVAVIVTPSPEESESTVVEECAAAAEDAEPKQEAPSSPSPSTAAAAEAEVKEEEKEEKKKERRKRRETIAALLSPRRNSLSSTSHSTVSKEDGGSVMAASRQGTMSGDLDVVHEGLVSPRGDGAQTMREKKKGRLTLKRFRRSELFSGKPGFGRTFSDDDHPHYSDQQPQQPQVQFLRVTKPLDALAEYKISPVSAESPVLADPSSPVMPVSHPHLALHVAPPPDSASGVPAGSQISPRIRSPTLRRDAPGKPLPAAPGVGSARPPLPSHPLPTTPSSTSSSSSSSLLSHTAPLPAVEVVVDLPPSTGATTFDFPNLEDLPIFQDLFPPPTHLGPPPPPPGGSAAGEAGGVC